MTQKQLDVIQEKIGYEFYEKDLLLQAFVRRSFAVEHFGYLDNENLEFIGDKVLDFVVVKKLADVFGGNYSGEVQSLESIERNEPESKNNSIDLTVFYASYAQGELTEIKKQIVQTKFLAKAIEKLGFEQYLIMGKGDVLNNIQLQPRVKEDLLESILGAVAIDCGWNISILENVVEKLLNLDYYVKNGVEDEIDYVSFVQAWHQKEYGTEPDYWISDSQFLGGMFNCVLALEGYDNASFESWASSKKSAIRKVAKQVYEYLQQKDVKGNKITLAIKEFNLENAVSKLQMLYDKKLIKGLEFIEEECSPTNETNGNPIWRCECKVDGVVMQIVFEDTKKKTAKNKAAYEMLKVLTGQQCSQETIELNSRLPF